MKKQLLILIASLICAYSSYATVWTVSNNPADSTSAQFSELQKAIDYAGAGDTILVSASLVSYGDIVIRKQLFLFGAGYHNSTNLNSTIGALNLGFETNSANYIVSSSSGTRITGFNIGDLRGYYGVDLREPINDIVIDRNQIGGFVYNYSNGLPRTNWMIKNNIITHINGDRGPIQNSIFSNNIILGNIGVIAASVQFNNNLFCSPASLYDVQYCVFNNNVFFGGYAGNAGYATFNNNISYGHPSSNELLVNYNTGVNNQIDVDPLFVNVSSTTFDYAYDYHLQATSPGKNAGTDGTDIGIYGGAYPFPSGGEVPWQTSIKPYMPQILEMNVLNAVIPLNDTLQVQVKAIFQK